MGLFFVGPQCFVKDHHVKKEKTNLDLALLLSVRTGIPEHLFYLVRQGKVLLGSWSLAVLT